MTCTIGIVRGGVCYTNYFLVAEEDGVLLLAEHDVVLLCAKERKKGRQSDVSFTIISNVFFPLCFFCQLFLQFYIYT